MRKVFAIAALMTVAVIASITMSQKQFDDPLPCILTNTCGMGNGGN